VSTEPTEIGQTPTSRDVIAPIKARACDALHAVLRSRQRRLDTDQRLMQRGSERC
jgi:hypothetical protein